jgi:hypothetical protein
MKRLFDKREISPILNRVFKFFNFFNLNYFFIFLHHFNTMILKINLKNNCYY